MITITSMTRFSLLQTFIRHNFPHLTVLVTENMLSNSEIAARNTDLDALCSIIENLTHTSFNKPFLLASEYLAIPIDRMTAYAICNQFSRSVLPLYVFHNGTCVYQNK